MKQYKILKRKIDKDKVKKDRKRKQNTVGYNDFDNVITYNYFIGSLKKCNAGVKFKYSVQKYNLNALRYIDNTIIKIRNGGLPKLGNIKKEVIRERGKERIITPIKIEDRITQKVLCDNALVPVFSKILIYDNGASMKNKGVDFARNRMNYHIEKAKREYGNHFYALVFDFKSFFDSIKHSECYRVMNDEFTDDKIISLTQMVIESYQILESKDDDEKIQLLKNHQGVGICLGSQISQLMALAVPNKFDHYIKDTLRIKHYLRYMDDGVILHKDKQYLQQILNILSKTASQYGLHFNVKKTRITSISKGFTFLKVHYSIKNGKTIKRLVRSGVTRMRRKSKKYKHLVDEDNMSLDDVYNSIQSWLSHAKIAKSYHTVKRMLKLYDELYGGYKITNKYFRNLKEKEAKNAT